MKPLFTAATAILLALIFSTSVFAHSHLGGTNPADGEILTEPITEIVLEFDGRIEQGSFIEVTTASGQEIELQDILIGESILTGTVSEPLANNDYHVNWSILSADGHPLEGEFSFTVNAPLEEKEEEVTEEASEAEDTVDEEKQATEHQEAVSSDEVKEESSVTTVILIALFIIIIAGGVFFFMKKRK